MTEKSGVGQLGGSPQRITHPAAGALLTCRYHGCREVAAVWLSVVHDRGHPLCEKHADEIKAYIAAKIDEALNA